MALGIMELGKLSCNPPPPALWYNYHDWGAIVGKTPYNDIQRGSSYTKKNKQALSQLYAHIAPLLLRMILLLHSMNIFFTLS